MHSKKIMVYDMHGNSLPADLLVCELYGAVVFEIFLINGKHHHFQCHGCGTSYCDGTCGNWGMKISSSAEKN